MTPIDLVHRLRAAMVGADDWYAIERSFTETVTDDEVDAARPAAYAFGYMLVDVRKEDSRARNGVFAPQIEWGDGRAFPAPLEQVDNETRDAWVELFGELDEPAAQARLGDLIWVTRHGQEPHLAGRAAAVAYTSLIAESSWSLMDRVDSAARALELTAELNAADLQTEAIDASLVFVREELDQREDWRPGTVLRVLERLVALPLATRPDGLRELVDETKARYGADPFIAESATQLQLALADAEERGELRADEVQRWRDAAKAVTGVARLSHLRHALELARTTQQAAVAREIALEIEALTPEDLDLKRQEVELEFPAEDIDRLVESFAQHDDALAALTRFGVEGPPIGDAAALDKRVAELAEQYPIQRLFSRHVLGDFNALVFEAKTPDDHDRVERASYAALGAQLFGPVAARVLATIRDSYERPDHAALTAFFASDLIDEANADRLADALRRHWNDDHDASGLILATQLEAVLRGMAARAGVPVTKPPRGASPGGVIGLGAVLDKLKGRLDESWRRYLDVLLADALGVNLRNRLAHGLAMRAEATDAALMIHVACFLRSLAATPGG